jgi:energy-coupling factor transporter ATP-binding protein EcfA2
MTSSVDGPDFDGTLPPLVTGIQVVGLFGLYDYNLVGPPESDGRLWIIHGDNGSGKTTILKMLFHLLSPADERGHRTFLARTKFERFVVLFSDRSIAHVAKLDGLVGSFAVTVGDPDVKNGLTTAVFSADDELRIPTRKGQTELLTAAEVRRLQQSSRQSSEYRKAPRGKSVDPHPEESQVLEFLAERSINPIMLADDRVLYSDDVELERLRDLGVGDDAPPGLEGDLVARELRLTLRRANEWFKNLTFGGQDSGSAGAYSIYRDVLTQLSHTGSVIDPAKLATDSSYDIALNALHYLGMESPKYEEFGLVTPLDTREYVELLEQVPSDRREVAGDILMPYLQTLATRLDALGKPEELLRAFLTAVNSFLVDKRMNFSPRPGLTITTSDKKRLGPESLSSGEKQLAMLLCTTMLAGRNSRLLIIDEPELSLGVTWQREILKSLLSLTRYSGLQVIIATHSLEILSSEPESLVALERLNAAR